MQFLVTIRVLETVVGPDDARVRRELGPEIQRMMASEKVEASGAFAGTRGGFFLSTLMHQRISTRFSAR